MELSGINSLLAAITAIATAITAIVTFFAFRNERKKRKIDLFSESIHAVLDGIKNSESNDYIVSNKYFKDIKTVKYYLGLSDTDKVGLDDFKKIVVQDLIKDHLTIEEDAKEELRKSYKKIKHYCERMDYLGVLAENEAASELIIRHFRHNIIDGYRRLEPLISKTREDSKDEDLYLYYTILYTKTINSSKDKYKKLQ